MLATSPANRLASRSAILPRKRWYFLLAWIGGYSGSHGQGLIDFRQVFYSSIISQWSTQSAPVYDQDGVTLLRGRHFSAQLYAAPLNAPDEALAPVLPVRDFAQFDGLLPSSGTNSRATIPNVPVGQIARLQLRVWDNAAGTITNWEAAKIRGNSVVFNSPALGDGKKSLPYLNVPAPFQLLPARSAISPGTAVLTEVYRNLDFPVFNPDNPPDFTSFLGMSSDSRLITLHFRPGYSFSPIPNDPRTRTTTYQRSLGEPHREALPYLLSQGFPTGITPDGQWGFQNGFNEAFLIRSNTWTKLPIRYIVQISGDGRYVFGWDTNDDYIRLQTATQTRTVIYTAGTQPGYGSIQCSFGGRVALMSAYQKPPLLWVEGVGMQSLGTPKGFVAMGMSQDSQTLVGYIGEQRPAYWNADKGLTDLSPDDPSLFGSVSGISADGQVLYGTATGRRGVLQFWTRDGHGYRLADLLPNGAGAGLKGWNQFEVRSISSDGRAAFITAKDEAGYVQWGDIGWIADLVFPGDGPRLHLERANSGLSTLKFKAPTGFQYRVQSGVTLGDWSAELGRTTGTGATVSMELPASGQAGWVRVVADPIP